MQAQGNTPGNEIHGNNQRAIMSPEIHGRHVQ